MTIFRQAQSSTKTRCTSFSENLGFYTNTPILHQSVLKSVQQQKNRIIFSFTLPLRSYSFSGASVFSHSFTLRHRKLYQSSLSQLRCDCGNLTYKTVNALKSGRVLSCGCKYRETRSETVKHRRDMVEGTNVSNIVVSKHLRSNNTSGHTGVGLDRRTGKWYAYINFQKKHYNLGLHKDKSAAIRARRAAEARLHDPVILEYWDSLTEKRKKEFQDYLRSTNK